MLLSCPFQNTFRKFTHECLFVGMSFAGNNQVGIFYHTVESDQIEQQVGTRCDADRQVLHEGITQSACGSCSRFLRSIPS